MRTRIATDIELIVLKWLDRNKIEYQFQSSLMGGYFELGGAVIDILIRDRNLAWRIMGEYWHRGVVPSGRDAIQREMLEAEGWTVVDIWSMDLEDPSRLEQTMRLALQGQEMPR